VNSKGNYTDTFVVPADPRHAQTYITLTPIVIRRTDNKFGIGSDYESEIMISPISQTVRGDNPLDYQYVQLYFSNTELTVVVTPQTIWDALRDIDGLLSLMLFFASFASFAGMRHIYQFTGSLRKSYQRASRAFRRHRSRLAGGDADPDADIGEDANLSKTTTALQRAERGKLGRDADNEFRDEFSFGSYLHLVWRLEHLEAQLKKRGVLNSPYTASEGEPLNTVIIPVGRPVDEEEGGMEGDRLLGNK
jgi:hypothetical protein